MSVLAEETIEKIMSFISLPDLVNQKIQELGISDINTNFSLREGKQIFYANDHSLTEEDKNKLLIDEDPINSMTQEYMLPESSLEILKTTVLELRALFLMLLALKKEKIIGILYRVS